MPEELAVLIESNVAEFLLTMGMIGGGSERVDDESRGPLEARLSAITTLSSDVTLPPPGVAPWSRSGGQSYGVARYRAVGTSRRRCGRTGWRGT
jgi:hypothetical protein